MVPSGAVIIRPVFWAPCDSTVVLPILTVVAAAVAATEGTIASALAGWAALFAVPSKLDAVSQIWRWSWLMKSRSTRA